MRSLLAKRPGSIATFTLRPGLKTGLVRRSVQVTVELAPIAESQSWTDAAIGFPRRCDLRLRLGPVVADTDVHGELRVEVVRAAHLSAHEVAHLRYLRLRHLEQQLVVYLQDEARAAAFLLQPACDVDHRDLDDVRIRALHDEVDGDALAEAARLAVRRADLGYRPTPPEQRRHVAVLLRLVDRPPDEVLHVREAREVRVYVLLRLLPRDLQVLRQAERRDAVDDAEVDHLRDRALARRQRGGIDAEHLRCRRGVNVLATRE